MGVVSVTWSHHLDWTKGRSRNSCKGAINLLTQRRVEQPPSPSKKWKEVPSCIWCRSREALTVEKCHQAINLHDFKYNTLFVFREYHNIPFKFINRHLRSMALSCQSHIKKITIRFLNLPSSSLFVTIWICQMMHSVLTDADYFHQFT